MLLSGTLTASYADLWNHVRKVLKQYAALTRISNLPTCWTNVLTGSAIGSLAASNPIAILPVVILSIIISLFYMAGMALNDLVDLKIDRQQRPDRPIASGGISPGSALIFIILLFISVTGLTLMFFPHCIYFVLILVSAITLYNITHKHFAFSVIFMALCRALIYVISAYAVFGGGDTRKLWTNTAISSTILALYIAFMTIIARSENKRQIDSRRWLSVAIMMLVPAVFVLSETRLFYTYIIAVILLIILSRAVIFMLSNPPRIKQAVLTWLACICLLDCLFLAVMANPVPAAAAGLCFAMTILSHRRIGGT
jgi:heme O synthase-like polyprenyltransferase